MAAYPMRRERLDTALLLLPASLFLLVWFVAPLSRLLSLAFVSDNGVFDNFTVLLSSSVYLQVLGNTLMLAALVTVITLLLAWPVAYVLTRLKGPLFVLTLYGVLFPLWISVLVRTFSWMLLLERGGPVNRLLMAAGIVDHPLALLFNETGVLIGMVHVLLPYAILPLYSAMNRIDTRLLMASDGLGAGVMDTFRRVYLPLCLPGLFGGGTFVLLLSLGFFITPALLGGANSMTLSMLISSFVTDRLAWSLAAAGSMVLLVIVLLLLGLTMRLLPMEKGMFAK
ncbi:MAG TPA: ABC transporter permease [Dongiaceae bacterium]|nr:ABC transporter permease [Dongiaceae bacterium]